MSHSYRPQDHAIQKRKVEQSSSRKKTLWPQTVRIWRTDQTHLQKESQNHQENHPQIVMQQVQKKKMLRRRQSQIRRPPRHQGNQKEEARQRRRSLQMIDGIFKQTLLPYHLPPPTLYLSFIIPSFDCFIMRIQKIGANSNVHRRKASDDHWWIGLDIYKIRFLSFHHKL